MKKLLGIPALWSFNGGFVDTVHAISHAIKRARGGLVDASKDAAGVYSVGDTFERMALRRLIEDLLTQQTDLTRTIMAFAGGPQAGDDADHARDAASSWSNLRPDKVGLARRTIDEIEASGASWTFAKLTIANAALRELAAEGTKRKR